MLSGAALKQYSMSKRVGGGQFFSSSYDKGGNVGGVGKKVIFILRGMGSQV